MVQKSGDHHLGFLYNSLNHGISTTKPGKESRISEPSTGGHMKTWYKWKIRSFPWGKLARPIFSTKNLLWVSGRVTKLDNACRDFKWMMTQQERLTVPTGGDTLGDDRMDQKKPLTWYLKRKGCLLKFPKKTSKLFIVICSSFPLGHSWMQDKQVFGFDKNLLFRIFFGLEDFHLPVVFAVLH